MENILKGTRHLVDVDKGKLHEMEQAALLLWQKYRVTCKVFKSDTKTVTIGITQANKPDGQYLSQRELIKVVHETYDNFMPGKKIVVHASPYEESPALQVNPEWIKKKMEDTGTKLKQISADTGMNYSHLSGLVGGTKPLTDAHRAMFYFYFKTKE